MSFKIGDWVRRTKEPERGMPIGFVGQVIGFGTVGDIRLAGVSQDLGARYNAWSQEYFELVAPPAAETPRESTEIDTFALLDSLPGCGSRRNCRTH